MTRKFFTVCLLLAAIGSLSLLLLAIAIAPWTHAFNTPVQLHVQAPSTSKLDICWDLGAVDCVPLVPYQTSSKAPDTSDLWLAEIPPRTRYELSVLINSPVDDAILRKLVLVDPRTLKKPLYQWDVADNSAQGPRFEAVIPRYANELFLSSNGGKIHFPAPVSADGGPTWAVALRIWVFLTGTAVMMLLLVIPLLRTEGRNPPVIISKPIPPLLYLAPLGAVILHFLIVLNAPVLASLYDSMGYLQKALALAEKHRYATGEYEFELTRLPGTSLVYAAAIKVLGYHLATLAFVQATLFCTAVILFGLSLHRWVRPSFLIAAICIAIVSPFQIFAARSIMSESIFATFSLVSLACLFQHIGSPGLRSQLWLASYAVCSTYATLVRPNGAVLFAALLPVCLPATVGMMQQTGPPFSLTRVMARAKAVGVFLAPYALTFLLCVMTLIAWSARNYLYRGYFGPSDMGALTRLNWYMASGAFDPRSLFEINAYQSYVVGKYANDYWYHAWHLRHAIYDRETDSGRRATPATLPALDTLQRRALTSVTTLLPWQAKASAAIKSLQHAMAPIETFDFVRNGIAYSYSLFTYYTNPQEVRDVYARWLSPKLIYDDRSESRLFNLFARAANWYHRAYVILFLLAIAAATYTLWRGQHALAAPIFVFLANVAVYAFAAGPEARYVDVFDTLLVFQVVLAADLMLNPLKSEDTTFKSSWRCLGVSPK